METFIQSPAAAAEETLCGVHTSVCKDLAAMAGGRVLFYGETRRRLESLKAVVERIIIGDEPMMDDTSTRVVRTYLSIMLRK